MKIGKEKPKCTTCLIKVKTYFNLLSEEDLRDLTIDKSCVIYKKGQNIYNCGNLSNGLYCLNSGQVKIYRDGPYGRDQIIRFIQPGNMFGIKALIEGKRYSTTATAVEESVVCFIPNRKVFELIMKYPNLTNQLLISLSRMLEDAEKKMASMALKPVRERVAESLVILNNTFNAEKDSNIFEIKISREDLASNVGSATETVIRILSDFKNEKLIEIRGRTIKILNLLNLMKVANMMD